MNDETVALRNECANIISLRDSLKRLEANQDFARVINNYLREEPIRITMLYGDAQLNQDEKRSQHRNELFERTVGIARFAEYLRGIYQRASLAEKQLYDLDHPDEGMPTEQVVEEPSEA